MIDTKIRWHLDNWGEWMLGGSSTGYGYPSRSPVFGVSGSKDVDTMVQDVDNRCAMAVNAIISDMNPAEQVACHHHHVSAVYRLNPDPEINARLMAKAYAVACEKVGRELDRRGII